MSGATVGNYKISLTLNSKQQWGADGASPQSLGSATLVLSEATKGAVQFSQLGEKLCKLLEIATEHTQFFKGAGKIFQSAMTPVGLLSTPANIINVKKSVNELFCGVIDMSGAFAKRVIVVIKDIATMVTTLGYSVAPFLNLSEKNSKIAEKVFSSSGSLKVVSDACSFVENAQDFWAIRNLSVEAQGSEVVDSETQKALAETCRLNMIKLTKSICSIAGFALGLGIVSAGFVSAPVQAIGIAAISLVGTLCGVGAGLYADQMKYKQINFFNPKHVKFEEQVSRAQTPLTKQIA